MLNLAEQEYPTLMLRQSEKDKELVKNEFVSAPIEVFGEVLNTVLRPSSPSTRTSMYENTFEFDWGDDLNAETHNIIKEAEQGMTDKQDANYQWQIQSMEKLTHESHKMSLGPLDKIRGKQAQWIDCEILGIPPEELNINRQEHLLKEIKNNQATLE